MYKILSIMLISLMIAVLSLYTPARGAVTTYTDEAAFLAALNSMFMEDFEGTVWDGVRSSVTTVNKAASITSQGVTWSSTENVTTGLSAGRTGYGIYSYPHGIPDSLTTTTGQPFTAAGGWFRTNTPPAQMNFILDDTTIVDFDDLPVDTQFSFRGVISTEGFSKIEFKEIEGTPGDQKFLFADDFVFSFSEAGANLPPSANAGVDQMVVEGALVFLDGSGSSDPDDGVASYMWNQITTTAVTLSNPTASQSDFTAPQVGPAGLAISFELTIADTLGLKDTDTVTIFVNDTVVVNQPPVADAGPDQSVMEGEAVSLVGSASSDAEGAIAAYSWSVKTGPDIALSDAALPMPMFVAPAVQSGGGVIVFSLKVTDEGGLSTSDDVSVTITDSGINTVPADMIPIATHMGDHWGVRVISGGGLVSIHAMDPADIDDTDNRPENIRFGLIDLLLKTDAPGGTAVVEIAPPSPAEADERWFKYDAIAGWHDYSESATFNSGRDRVSITLTDGGVGDGDNASDGIITDPSGIGTPQSTSSPSPNPDPSPTPSPDASGGGGGGCFISTILN